MNHGIVCFRADIVASTIWEMAMGRSQFVAVYTERMLERHRPGHDSGASWNTAFVRSIGEPAVLDPEGFGQKPGFRHPTGEYARYEPACDVQFCAMVEHSASCAFLSVAVPAPVGDEEAQRLLGEMYPAMFQLHERYWDQPHEKRRRHERRLRDVVGLIALHEEWAFVISSFDRYTPVAIVLSDNYSYVGTVVEAVVARGNRDDLVEKW